MTAPRAAGSPGGSGVSTLVCVPIMAQDEDTALADAHAARAAGADLVEFRLDEFDLSGSDGPERAVRLVSRSPLPCIATCRPTWEGGSYDGEDAARIALFERLGTAFGAGEHPPRFIDVEAAAYARSANLRLKVGLAVAHPEQVRDLSTSLVLSMHDFDGRPADLDRRLLEMRRWEAARVLKIAFRARSLRDNLELFDLLAQRDRPTIALGMGEFGVMSRVLAPKFGAFLTFASLRDSSATAPGQPTIEELLGVYRFRSIGPRTRVLGVAGWPISRSLSPRVHNAGFEATGFDGVYVPLPIAASGDADADFASFKATVLDLVSHPRLDFAGCSVTIPHKEHLSRLAQQQGWSLDAASAATGAANTLVVDGGGAAPERCRVLNTDSAAIADVLRGVLGPGRRAIVVGTGGAARAAAHAALEAGCEVVVAGRSERKARALVESLQAAIPRAGSALSAAALGAIESMRADACVHCTPVGMAGGPEPGGCVVPIEALARVSPGLVVLETVYAPRETPLVRRARAAGVRLELGAAMFVRQAERQFEAWTGAPPPMGLFQRVVDGAA